MADPITVGSVATFNTANITLNGAAWDLTGATVTATFTRPDGTKLVKSCTVAGTPGVASYTTTTSDLNVAGQWSVSFHIVQAPLTENTKNVPFVVAPSSSAP